MSVFKQFAVKTMKVMPAWVPAEGPDVGVVNIPYFLMKVWLANGMMQNAIGPKVIGVWTTCSLQHKTIKACSLGAI